MAEKEMGKYLLLILIGAGIIFYLNQQGYINLGGQGVQQAPTVIQVPQQGGQQIIIQQPTVGKVPIETLKVKVKDKYTMADISDVQIQFWSPGADVSNPNQKPLDTLTTGTDGVGTTTNMVLQTQTDYDVYFNSSSNYYDELIENWEINYNPDTGKGYLIFKVNGQDLTYYPAVKVGAFVDVADLPEVSSSINESTTEDTIYYDLSAGTGSFYFRIDIGNANANSELHDVVMCFRDSDGDMDGDEITSLTATYVSGSTNIILPGDLLGYWRDAMGPGGKRCIKIADMLGSSEKARWEIAGTVDESNFATSEEFEITFDDNGDYSAKQYPSRSVKATAETLTFAIQE